MKKIIIYCLKVWLTSLALTPITESVIIMLKNHEAYFANFSVIAIGYIVIITVLLIPSLISWSVMLFLLKFILTLRLSGFAKKSIIFLGVMVLSLVLIGAIILGNNDAAKTFLLIALGFWITTAVGLWFFKLPFPQPAVNLE